MNITKEVIQNKIEEYKKQIEQLQTQAILVNGAIQGLEDLIKEDDKQKELFEEQQNG